MRDLIIMLACLLSFVIGLYVGTVITTKAYTYPTKGEGYKATQFRGEKP